MNRRQQTYQRFHEWWCLHNKAPKSRTQLLADARKLADAETEIRVLKAMHENEMDQLMRYEAMRDGWVAGQGVGDE